MDETNLVNEMTNALQSGQLDQSGSTPQQPAGQNVPSWAADPNLGYDPNYKIKYKASGKDLEEPMSMILQRAQRGYDYAQLVNEHKQRETAIGQREQQLMELETKWKPYEDFATQNPQWADHVRQAWENRYGFSASDGQSMAPQQTEQLNSSLPPELAKEISDLRSFRDEYLQERKLREEEKQQEALNSEIDGVRKQYTDIDFGYTDPATGKSLEMQVLEHGIRRGINSFAAAFRDLCHDQLIARAEMRAKEQILKDQQGKIKQGFVAESNNNMMAANTPQTGQLKSRSYEDLLRQGVADLGIQF
jgi:hypothetical protein